MSSHVTRGMRSASAALGGSALLALSMLGIGCTEGPGQESAPPSSERQESEPAPRTTSLPVEVDAEGALRFPSIAAFVEVQDALARMSTTERDAWERELGFVSMRRAFDDLMADVSSSSPHEAERQLAANRDLLDEDAAEPRRRIASSAYAWVVDRRGVMYVDGVIHRVSANELFTPQPGASPEVTRQLASDVTAPTEAKPGRVDVFRYAAEEASLATCGSLQEGTSTVGDRRVTYRIEVAVIKVVDGIGNRQYRHAYTLNFWGKRKILGSWLAYDTTYQIYNTFGNIDVFRITGFDGFRHQYVYERQDRGWPYFDLNDERSHLETAPAWAGDAVLNVDESQLAAPTFHKLRMEATSRGTYPTRGILSCNYCGDGTCQAFVAETAYSCSSDCNQCGDGICAGSDPTTCPRDCPPPDPDPPCTGNFCP